MLKPPVIVAAPPTVRPPSRFTPAPPNINPLGSSVYKLAFTFKLFTVAVPVKVGLSRGAFKSRAVCVLVLMFLAASLVLSTFPSWTMAFVRPVTVPVKAGLSEGALRFIL